VPVGSGLTLLWVLHDLWRVVSGRGVPGRADAGAGNVEPQAGP
jgi:hypothetical protein